MLLASPADPIAAKNPVAAQSVFRRFAEFGSLTVTGLFGFASLVVGLAVATTVPGLQPLVLGYLLEVSARTARSGRLCDGFIGLTEAAHLGGTVIAMGICFLPATFLSSLAIDASMIEPGGDVARRSTIAFYIVAILTMWHVVGSLLRGGRIRSFLRPRPIDTWRRLRQPHTFDVARDTVWRFVSSMRLPYLYWLGLRVAIGSFVWLGLPVTLMFFGREFVPAAFLGGLLTAVVFAWLPWLQTQSAVGGGQVRRLFAVSDMRRRFRCAPWASAAALVFMLTTALPLYLLKIEMVPRKAAWLLGIVFVLFAFPGRLALGRAFAYAERRRVPRRAVIVWPAKLIVAAAATIYVVGTFLSQATSWNGRHSLYEQHVVLFPEPFWPTR